MKLGFVGLGLIGARRAKIARLLGHEIVFMVDPDQGRREALEIAGCTYAASAAELGDVHADAIFIAVPHDLALPTCEWAFARGAHVLCEKPMGLSPDQARRIAAAAAGKQFCAGFNFRYLPGVAALRVFLREGKLGELHRARLVFAHGGRPGMEAEWKLKRARAGGGALIDPGIHLIDLALHLIGPDKVDAVALRRRFWQSDVEDNCLVMLRRAQGDVDVALEVSLTSWKNQFAIELYGSDGMAVLHGRGGNYGAQKVEYVNRWFWQGPDGRVIEDLGDDPSFELETQAFLDKIAGGADDGILSGIEDGIAALDMVHRAYASDAEGAMQH